VTDLLADLAACPKAYGGPLAHAVLRDQAADFEVEEVLGFEPEGDGEHAFVWLEKCGSNTQYVAKQLAKFAGVKPMAVSFSGLKDRHAITRQWFSVHLPGQPDPDWGALRHPEFRILKASRHPRKLRRGVHRGNRFVITMRDIDGDLPMIETLLSKLATGVPNYFGEQRFGIDGQNLLQAQRWFNGEIKPNRAQQGFYLSAVRAFLFNRLLAARIESGSWATGLSGDIYMLDGTQSLFLAEEDVSERVVSGDIHPTGALPGVAGKLCPAGEALTLEQHISERYPELFDGLCRHRVNAERRALRVVPVNLQLTLIANDAVCIRFELPRGSFATALIAELFDYKTNRVTQNNK
jgi:tRNA pseudouridine13 synthase